MADLTHYLSRILVPEDRPLFEDAAKCAAGDSLRAAYVMIWLSVAESLKRRFREAQLRDGTAGKIVGQFEQKESEQKSVDKFLLEKAKEYGFLSDSAYSLLMHVYEMRCLYGHPYEIAPTQEQIVHAASVAVDYLLSQPVRLKHGFARPLLDSMLTDKSYLDDQPQAVKLFADEILPRIDDSILPWMLDKYWSELEKIALDASLKLFTWRGVWFTREVLNQKGATLLTHDQWHLKVAAYPVTLIRVARSVNVFANMGPLAQDSLLGRLIDLSQGGRASLLQYFERLLMEGVLSERQSQRLTEHIDAMDVRYLKSCGLTTKTTFNRIVTALKSRTWPVQNPAVKFFAANGPDQAAELTSEQLIVLGRNVLQAAEGSAGSCSSFLIDLKNDNARWPEDLLKGIVYECFTNEADQVRFKARHLGTVSSILESRDDVFAAVVVNTIVDSIRRGHIKHEWKGRNQFSEVCAIIRDYSWAGELVGVLNEAAERLPEEDANE